MCSVQTTHTHTHIHTRKRTTEHPISRAIHKPLTRNLHLLPHDAVLWVRARAHTHAHTHTTSSYVRTSTHTMSSYASAHTSTISSHVRAHIHTMRAAPLKSSIVLVNISSGHSHVKAGPCKELDPCRKA